MNRIEIVVEQLKKIVSDTKTKVNGEALKNISDAIRSKIPGVNNLLSLSLEKLIDSSQEKIDKYNADFADREELASEIEQQIDEKKDMESNVVDDPTDRFSSIPLIAKEATINRLKTKYDSYAIKSFAEVIAKEEYKKLQSNSKVSLDFFTNISLKRKSHKFAKAVYDGVQMAYEDIETGLYKLDSFDYPIESMAYQMAITEFYKLQADGDEGIIKDDTTGKTRLSGAVKNFINTKVFITATEKYMEDLETETFLGQEKAEDKTQDNTGFLLAITKYNQFAKKGGLKNLFPISLDENISKANANAYFDMVLMTIYLQTHPILTEIDSDMAKSLIADLKKELEKEDNFLEQWCKDHNTDDHIQIATKIYLQHLKLREENLPELRTSKEYKKDAESIEKENNIELQNRFIVATQFCDNFVDKWEEHYKELNGKGKFSALLTFLVENHTQFLEDSNILDKNVISNKKMISENSGTSIIVDDLTDAIRILKEEEEHKNDSSVPSETKEEESMVNANETIENIEVAHTLEQGQADDNILNDIQPQKMSSEIKDVNMEQTTVQPIDTIKDNMTGNDPTQQNVTFNLESFLSAIIPQDAPSHIKNNMTNKVTKVVEVMTSLLGDMQYFYGTEARKEVNLLETANAKLKDESASLRNEVRQVRYSTETKLAEKDRKIAEMERKVNDTTRSITVEKSKQFEQAKEIRSLKNQLSDTESKVSTTEFDKVVADTAFDIAYTTVVGFYKNINVIPPTKESYYIDAKKKLTGEIVQVNMEQEQTMGKGK